MKNHKGFVGVETLLAIIIGALVVFFVPNPVSQSVGVGIKPNKTIQTEKIELIKDKEGCPIAYKTTCSDRDIPQKVTLWEQLRALPGLWLLLMILGVFCTPIAGLMAWINNGLKKGFTQIVTGVEEAKKELTPEAKTILETNLSKKMDSTPKALVKKIKVKL